MSVGSDAAHRYLAHDVQHIIAKVTGLFRHHLIREVVHVGKGTQNNRETKYLRGKFCQLGKKAYLCNNMRKQAAPQQRVNSLRSVCTAFATQTKNWQIRMAKKEGKELTPMMKQFFDLKAKHPDAVMLFRCGDFYETYCEDAVTAAKILGITLTHRNNGAGVKSDEMAGFPITPSIPICRSSSGPASVWPSVTSWKTRS